MWEHQRQAAGRVRLRASHVGDQRAEPPRSMGTRSISDAELTRWFNELKDRREEMPQVHLNVPKKVWHARSTAAKYSTVPRPGTAVRRHPTGLLEQERLRPASPELISRMVGSPSIQGRHYEVPGWFEYAVYDGSCPGVFYQELASTTPFVAKPRPPQLSRPSSTAVPRPQLSRPPSAVTMTKPQLSRPPSAAKLRPPNVVEPIPDPPVLEVQRRATPPPPCAMPDPGLTEELILTARPDFGAALGLEQAMNEARSRMDPTSAKGLRLLSNALAKRADQRREFKRCLRLREGRLEAFRRCEPITQAIMRIVAAANEAAEGDSTVGLRRLDLMDWHRCLIKGGFLRRSAIGRQLAREPFCYVPPAYLEYARQFLEGGVLAKTVQEVALSHSHGDAVLVNVERIGHADELMPRPNAHDEEHAKEVMVSDADEGGAQSADGVAIWDAGVKLWRLLVNHGAVQNGELPFDAFVEVVFELADAHVSHALRHYLTEAGSSVYVPLQEYLDFANRLVKACVAQPPDNKGVSTPSPSRRGSMAVAPSRRGSIAAAVTNLPNILDENERPQSSQNRRASVTGAHSTADAERSASASSNRPPHSNSRRTSLTSLDLFALEHVRSETPVSRRPSLSLNRDISRRPRSRLRYAWPAAAPHAQECMRKVDLLRQAIIECCSGSGLPMKDAALREFRKCCQLAGERFGPLGYAQLERALREMPGEMYASVTFRHVVVGRERSDEAIQLLSDASMSDESQMFCFLRAIDVDCDGSISPDDFCQAVEMGLADLEDLDARWHEVSALRDGAGATRLGSITGLAI